MTIPISPQQFDEMAARAVSTRPDRLWGRRSIARHLGVSEDTVATWSKIDGVPIYEPLPGRYVAFRSELDRWLRTKHPASP